jgi:polyphosphate kinase
MAEDTTVQSTDIKQAPWCFVPSDDKWAARLDCTSHLSSHFDDGDAAAPEVPLPQMRGLAHVRPPLPGADPRAPTVLNRPGPKGHSGHAARK